MAVRTGGPGPTGLSLLVVPLKNTKGVTMTRIQVAGQKTGATTFIDLDDVRVPVENIIGQEGKGMQYIMTNFNHERLSICIMGSRLSRIVLSDAFSYCMKREAFGKTLIEQPVVRHRLSKCGAMLESQWAWVEQLTYMMNTMTKAQADQELGGLTAMAKAQVGVLFDECARCNVLLHGGNGFTKTGQGQLAEQMYREVPGIRIPGGSEDIMFDLGIRQLLKNYERKAKL